MAEILIVEDEPDIAGVVDKYLQAAGYDTHLLAEGGGVVSWVRKHQPSLIVLDLMLPGVDGLTICRELRTFTDLPIIITTARVEEIDRLIGFEAGADDYLCKPYSARELVARIKSLLRRTTPSTDAELLLLPDKHEVCLKGLSVALTALEFSLFELFFRHPGRIYSRNQILEQAYNDFRDISDRTVDSHIRNLRKKLRHVGLENAIQSVYGAGYKYLPPDTTQSGEA